MTTLKPIKPYHAGVWDLGKGVDDVYGYHYHSHIIAVVVTKSTALWQHFIEELEQLGFIVQGTDLAKEIYITRCYDLKETVDYIISRLAQIFPEQNKE